MTTKEKIAELEKRIAELEKRPPVVIHNHPAQTNPSHYYTSPIRYPDGTPIASSVSRDTNHSWFSTPAPLHPIA
jgi:hypothetical protein